MPAITQRNNTHPKGLIGRAIDAKHRWRREDEEIHRYRSGRVVAALCPLDLSVWHGSCIAPDGTRRACEGGSCAGDRLMYDEMSTADLIVTAHQRMDRMSDPHMLSLMSELVNRLTRLDIWRSKMTAVLQDAVNEFDSQ